jgi:membrane complex biogenesis BtpA family protein
MRDLFPFLPFIGMVHLLPLPGAPRWGGSMQEVLDRALRDAEALAPADGLIVENYLDAPFHPARVPAETIAALSVVVAEVVKATHQPVGVNVLRNDALGALAVAAATGARFIRVNVHTGLMIADQGILTGTAHETLRERARIAPGVAIAADVLVKHAVAPAGLDAGQAASDAWQRGLADALIVSGIATGAPADVARLKEVRRALPEAVVWIGSGITPANAGELLPFSDGAIVGSSLANDGIAGGGIDPAKARAMAEVFAHVRRALPRTIRASSPPD